MTTALASRALVRLSVTLIIVTLIMGTWIGMERLRVQSWEEEF